MKKYLLFLPFIFICTSLVLAGGDFATPRPKNVILLKTLPDGTYPVMYPSDREGRPYVQSRLLPNGKKTFTVLFVLWDLNFETETIENILGEVEAHELEWRNPADNPNLKATHMEIKNGRIIYWHPDAKVRAESYCVYKIIAGKDC